MAITIGIVGGVASGKSRVAAAFERLGAVVLNADSAGHAVLREPEVISAIRQQWGQGVIAPDGHVDRSAVAAIVFCPSREADRRWLNELTHPRIRARLKEQKLAAERRGVKAVVVDAALLFESGWSELCDQIVFVDTPIEQRRRNAASRGWDDNEIGKREHTQLALEEKRRRSTCVIQNDGTLEELDAAVGELFRKFATESK
jgi:dephospho-CoA kinase